jgi:hypothetical protein
MSTLIEFPGAVPAPEAHTERDENEVHAEAFRDLEGHIRDCATMAEITSQFMANAQCTDERLAFSVFHLTETLLNLKKYYYAAWLSEDALTKRLITSPAKATQELKEAYGSLPAEDQS